MVRQKMKAKKRSLGCKKIERTNFEDFSQCLEDDSEQEITDLYEGIPQQREEKSSNSFENMDLRDISDISSQLEVISESCATSQGEQSDELTMQCVPEISSTPPSSLHSKPEDSPRRPRFKVTPKRKPSPHKIRKLKMSSHMPSDSSEDEDNEIIKAKKRKEGSWVQCSKTDCLKWRKLPNDVEPVTMPERWVCHMNPDELHQECNASQETCDSQLDYDVVYTPFIAGSIVWAKVPGYPWWPGMVDNDPDYNCCYETDESNVHPISYHVSFVFDKDVSRSWVSCLSIRSFIGEDPNEALKTRKVPKGLSKAKALARTMLDVPLKERLLKYSFAVLYKGPIATTDHVGSQKSHSKAKSKATKVKKRKKMSSETVEDGKTPSSFTEKLDRECDEVNTQQSENNNTEWIVVKAKKKRKKVLLSSEDEDDEQDKTVEPPDHKSQELKPRKISAPKKKKKSIDSESKDDSVLERKVDDEVPGRKSEEILKNKLEKDGKQDGEKKAKKQKKKSKDGNKSVNENESCEQVEGNSKVNESKDRKQDNSETVLKKKASNGMKDNGTVAREMAKKPSVVKKKKMANKKGDHMIKTPEQNGEATEGKQQSGLSKKKKKVSMKDGEEGSTSVAEKLSGNTTNSEKVCLHAEDSKENLKGSQNPEKEEADGTKKLSQSEDDDTSACDKEKLRSSQNPKKGKSAVIKKRKISKDSGTKSSDTKKTKVPKTPENKKSAANKNSLSVENSEESNDVSKSDDQHKNSLQLKKKSDPLLKTLSRKPASASQGKEDSHIQLMNDPAQRPKTEVKKEAKKKKSSASSKDGASLDEKKKAKKMKKSQFTIPALNQETKGKSVDCAEGKDTKVKVTHAVHLVDSKKSSKSSNVSGSQKKSKAMFAKFKAPVRASSEEKTLKRKTIKSVKPPQQDSTLRSTMSPGSMSRGSISPGTITHTTTTMLSGKHAEEDITSDGPLPGDLDNYVSIGALEEDINSLYQQLSEGDVTTAATGFRDCDRAAAGDRAPDCVTVEFLDDELTMSMERDEKPLGVHRSITDSPEF